MDLPFYKWQAFGNDFILIEGPVPSFLISALCDRRFGIGADGLISLSFDGPYPVMAFFNADGSEPSMCGNGLRSALYHLRLKNRPLELLWKGRYFSAHQDLEHLFVDMPIAQLIKELNDPYVGCLVDAGVPHFLVHDPVLSTAPLSPDIFKQRNHPNFGKEGSNITFYTEKKGVFYVRTCERGVDAETLACGSAAIAVSVLSKKPLTQVVYKTGQSAWVKKNKDKTWLAGDAKCVFQGVYFLNE